MFQQIIQIGVGKPAYRKNKQEGGSMDERVLALRGMEPKNAGRGSYVAILEAAAGLFGQFPAEAITLRDILSIAGVSNQTLYNYFPNGRDDIVVALYDRYQRTMVEDFNNHISLINFDESQDDLAIINKISACLGRAVLGPSRASYPVHSALFEYLRNHHLFSIASHSDELEEAMAQALGRHLGARLSAAELPRVSRLSVRLVREVANSALEDSALSLEKLESNARLLARTLLRTGLKVQDGPSGGHAFQPQEPASSAIQGAPISPLKKQSILERILKRKARS
jgi:AcrR family transcriptional regulator